MQKKFVLSMSLLLVMLTGCNSTDSKTAEVTDNVIAEEQAEKKEITEIPVSSDVFVYEYYDREGELQLTLSYDEGAQEGTVTLVKEGKALPLNNIETDEGIESEDFYCMLPHGSTETSWAETIETWDTRGDIGGLEEIKEWDEASGKPLRYEVCGKLEFMGEEGSAEPPVSLLKIIWNYNEEGKLISREYVHHSLVFGTTFSYLNSYFDEQERVEYEEGYITHGCLNYYYIYEDEKEVPEMILLVDDMGGDYWTALTVYTEE